ncbi:hypothetical protein AMS57_01060 [Pseudoalteromonas undina]|uniref:hypothetical protein n=1 Tax=Pseudoalteromonas undina TaxID=43660 RepID=UPI0006BAF7BB|nr:hypothetical protein [Pseudoalteromonas undina]KPH92150.1 hypothetical protein AMS57_01060 [Pseudoalteromonas undina]
MFKYIFSLLFILSISGCNFEVPGADEKFGTQNFVSAISLIELHKIRNGVYPKSLDDLEFLGDWDGIWLSAVKYEKTDNGYNLYLERGWASKPSLEFPIKFKSGLGIQKTNIKWIEK